MNSTFTIDSNYNYFYTSYGNDPVAIVAINKNYELVKVSGRRGIVTSWQQFETDGKKLKELVDAIKAYSGHEGLRLTDPQRCKSLRASESRRLRVKS